MKIDGVDTIGGLVGTPPMVMQVDYDTIKSGELVRQLWNKMHMAFIPYCFVCKEPLVWHSPPDKDNVIFHCPKCERQWVRDYKWIAKEKPK